MPVPPFPRFLQAHDLMHCDGLVLVGTQSAAWVLNLAMRRVVELPWGRIGGSTSSRSLSHLEAFGLGRDPCSNAYKVVCFFIPLHVETVPQTPWFHIKRRLAAICFKGSWIWAVNQMVRDDQLGFLRFRLDEETFSLVPPPPCCVGLMNRSLDMWICTDLDLPQLEKCYNILLDWTQPLQPVAMLGNGVLVCRSSGNYLHRCNFQPLKGITHYKEIGLLQRKYCHKIIFGTLVEYPGRTATYFDAFPCVPSFVLI
ncbi:hypothetical protein VPH35_056771 [Triticum aestivum]